MIRTLYANGCSFIEGKELEEEDPEMLVLAKSRDMASQLRVRAYRNSLSWRVTSESRSASRPSSTLVAAGARTPAWFG